MADSFFIREAEDRFAATEWTVGPWNAESQHAGPPSALLGRALEQATERDDVQVARATFEILRPVPITAFEVRAEVVRSGRSVMLTEASLFDDKGEVMRARGWSIRTTELDLDRVVHGPTPPAGPGEGRPSQLWPVGDRSYLQAMEWRFVRGAFVEPGPATVWARMRYPLIEGEEITPLTRVLILADTGNGASSALDFTKWIFINPDLTVYLHRLPRGEWVCLDAQTTLEPSGIGLAASVLSDEDGVIGRGMQSLFVGPQR